MGRGTWRGCGEEGGLARVVREGGGNEPRPGGRQSVGRSSNRGGKRGAVEEREGGVSEPEKASQAGE